MGRTLGQADDPLLVSVRSGAKFSMPGMMETVLNIGLNDESVAGPGEDLRQRAVRLGLLPTAAPDVRHHGARHRAVVLRRGARRPQGLSGSRDRRRAGGSRLREPGVDVQEDRQGRDRLRLPAVTRATSSTWRSAPSSRRGTPSAPSSTAARNGSRTTSGRPSTSARWCSATSVTTRGPASASRATRPPGHQGVYGDYLPNAQGEDVVAGIRNTLPLTALGDRDKASYDELLQIMETLERHYHDMCDIEFTVERGKLWMLQTRVGKRTAAAAFRVAMQFVDEGLIDKDEALRRVTGDQLANLMFPQFDKSSDLELIAKGMAASPGAAVGKAAFDSATAVAWATKGEDVILVRRETNPDDLRGMIAARGVLTSRGGKTSHAAVVARGMGRTCVVGVEALRVDPRQRQVTTPDGHEVLRGRRDLDRRLHGRGVRRCGAGDRERRRRGLARRRRSSRAARARRTVDDAELVAAVTAMMEHADADPPDGRASQRRQPGGRPAGPRLRRPGNRAVPDRAHVPRRRVGGSSSASSWRAPTRTARRRSKSCCRCSARTSSGSSRPWTGCPSWSGCSTRRCTSSCPT